MVLLDPQRCAWLELRWLHALLGPGEPLVVAARGDEVFNRMTMRRGVGELIGLTRRSVETAGGVVPFAVKTGALITGAALLAAILPADADPAFLESDEPGPPTTRLVRVAAGVSPGRLLLVGVGEGKTADQRPAWHGPLWSASWTWQQLARAPLAWSEGRILGKAYVDLDLGEGVDMRSFRFFPRGEAPGNLDDARSLRAHVERALASG